MRSVELSRVHRYGFTLLELLLVIAIIGILGGLGFNTFAVYQQVQRLDQVRSQVTVDIKRARQLARRYNVSYTITFNTDGTYTSTATDSGGTVLTQLTGPPVTDLPKISGKLPTNMAFTTNAEGTAKNSITYRAPFSRIAAAKPCIGIGLSALGRTFGTEIHVVGVTGKVIPRSINSNQTTALCPTL
jgi:prepilin-type N-terminal cleavage/methylation domain-containing protein